MKIYDSHTHLNQEDLFKDWEKSILGFIQAGGCGLINAGANENYNNNGIYIAQECEKQYPKLFVKCALGWHPCDVEDIISGIKDPKNFLKQKILDNRKYVVAIGECGIDLHYDKTGETLEDQKIIFRVQCELAEELNLPIMIHSRDAFLDTYEILKDFSKLTIYVHCRGYSKSELEQMLNTFNKLFIGFCGNITYKNAENLRESIKSLPQDKLLIETDAPYLSPQGYRGKINVPERVNIIGNYIANLLGIKEEKLREQVEKNFFNLYGSQGHLI